MIKEKTATFIGHRDCYGVSKDAVRGEILRLIESGVTCFLNGGMGTFDMMCANIVFELKKKFPQVENQIVIPYLTFNIAGRECFDSVVYPDGFEKYHFKSAIPARNKYMIEHSAYAVCYVTHVWGGAAKTLEQAQSCLLYTSDAADEL